MRLTPRRRSEGDGAPSRGPVAAYAGILDGQHLWLTLESGHLAALHDASTGTTIHLAGDITDLLATLPDAEATYDVVHDGKPVWIAPAADDPVRVPVSPDGGTQLSLARTDSGHLRVTRRALLPTALLEAIELRDGDVHLTLRPPDGVRVGTRLLLLDADDQLLDQLPVTAHDGRIEALVGVHDLPAGYFGVVRLVLGTEDSWVRIRRRRSDLTNPHGAVLLPELSESAFEGDDPDVPRARFRWNPDSLLVFRVLDPAELTGPDATVTPVGSHP